MSRVVRGRHAALPAPRSRVSYTQVLRNTEFRALYTAETLSIAGDQVAKFALMALVYARTHSAFLTALTYAVTFLPWLIGGPLLSGLADRRPRRDMMIRADLARAGLVGVMAVPWVPLPALLVLLFAVTLLEPPFQTSRAALVPDVLGSGEDYIVGSTLTSITLQFGQVAGFAAGGAVVVALTARGALLFDAWTFVASALILRTWVRRRPAVIDLTGAEGRRSTRATEGWRTVRRWPLLRSLVLLAWVGGAFSIPAEGLAVAYAHRHGAGTVGSGLLLASLPLGQTIAGVVVSRLLSPETRNRLMLPMAGLCFVALLPTAFGPGVPWTFACWLVSGAGSAFQIAANKLFVATVPNQVRGRAFGVAQTGLIAVQGLGLLVAGAAGQAWPLGDVVAVSGALGGLSVAALAVRWPRRPAGPPLPPTVRSSFAADRPKLPETTDRVTL